MSANRVLGQVLFSLMQFLVVLQKELWVELKEEYGFW